MQAQEQRLQHPFEVNPKTEGRKLQGPKIDLFLSKPHFRTSRYGDSVVHVLRADQDTSTSSVSHNIISHPTCPTDGDHLSIPPGSDPCDLCDPACSNRRLSSLGDDTKGAVAAGANLNGASPGVHGDRLHSQGSQARIVEIRPSTAAV